MSIFQTFFGSGIFFNRCFLLFMFIASPSRRVYLPSVGAKDIVDHCRANSNSHRRKWRAFLFPEWVPCSVGRSREGTVMWQTNTKVYLNIYIYTVYIWRIWSQQDGSIWNRIFSWTNNCRPQNLGPKKTPPGACRLLVPDTAGSSATTTRASCSPRAIVVRFIQLKKPCHRNVDVSHPSPQLHLDPGRQGVGGLPSDVYNSQGLS